MSTVTYPYIEVAEDGRAYIAGEGFRFKVRMLVEEQRATGARAEELQQGHPQLSLSQIYSALAYYHDHKFEIDREIEELQAFAEEFRAQQGESPLARKLREMGKDLP
jgi:uncharacterized protein (DUF433 family)